MVPDGPGRGRLPAEVTGFVGREPELAQLTALLGQARIVTVTGYGGVGKTRLALRAAGRPAFPYPDGVALLNLGGVRDPAQLLPALAEAVGPDAKAARRPGQAPDGDVQLDRVLGNLRHRRLLLIWDTCEHLIEPCARLAELVLRQAPGVTILATSRQPLDVPGEHVVAVPPLPVPGMAAGTDPGSAVELLAQRAASVIPGFSVTGKNRAAVIALCQRLDGIPLAIELAALRMRALPLEELFAGSEAPGDSSRALTGARRTTVSRHQTVRQSIEWSRSLCTPVESTVWARLSVFTGSFDLTAAESACGGDLGTGQVTEAVIGLVDKSVLLREPPVPGPPGSAVLAGRRGEPRAATHAGEPATRYRLPHSARDIGRDLLSRTDDAGAAVRERYVAHWTAAAENFASHVIDDQHNQFLALRREHANLMVACDLAPVVAGGGHVARLATALSLYWLIAGHVPVGRRWLDTVADQRSLSPGERARVLAARALLAVTAGDMATGLADAEASIALGDQAGDLTAWGRGKIALHRALCWSGDLGRAAPVANEAVPVLEEAGDLMGVAHLELQVAVGQLTSAPGECARTCARALRRLPRAELWVTSSLLAVKALALYREGDLDAASEAATRALALKCELGDIMGIASGIAVLGFLAGHQGRHDRATLLLGAATPLWEPTGTRYAGIAFLEDTHRKTVRAALDNLGEATYASFRETGAAMPLEEVIALASRLDVDAGLLPRVALWPAELPAAAPIGPLTGREVQIAALVARGLSNREIAERVTVSKRTVDAHVDHIFTKLNISSRIQLTNWLRDRIPRARSGQELGTQ
jgi:non-specific serine/threonine protein kinase